MRRSEKRAVKNFFTLLFSGKLSKAEESLSRLRKRLEDDGYYKALHGIYYAYVHDDRDSFLFQLWERYLEGRKKEELRKRLEGLLKEAYDPPKGFIRAWLDLIDMLNSLPVPHKIDRKRK